MSGTTLDKLRPATPPASAPMPVRGPLTLKFREQTTGLANACPEPKILPPSADPGRVEVDGKFFRLSSHRWFLRGLTYGPFAPNDQGCFLPPADRVAQDFERIARLGANAIRVYHIPPVGLLDEALRHGVRVMVDVPWQKHRCFLEDWSAQKEALRSVRTAAESVGNHPAVFALSVGNEIPHDVVRFYGAGRLEKFIGQLLAEAREVAPACPLTYANYPSTEFLTPSGLDFYCANVYLDDPAALGDYLDRLHHVAGNLPLILGEHGVEASRHPGGRPGQAGALAEQLREVFRRGLAGSFVFSFTDDWFTGGHQVEGWEFGVTDRDRGEKPAAVAVSDVWARVPATAPQEEGPLPRVSVVVCSYNGGATLEGCLRALGRLEYADYEVILVDDGSTDDTPAIAEKFPAVRYVRQENRGLSAARNAGLSAATGQIVAYTDADCAPDPAWLHYLVTALRDQGVDAIGGPNVPPPCDSWVAKCVAASPGGPSHVMLDDRRAEHVPGCNMAFDREKLLAIGGFDDQFWQAGDDVDVCWRWMDAGLSIGFSPAALVWHHRRDTARKYLRQQQGYGHAEALLHLKHPRRFNAIGASRWSGVIYGEGAVALPVVTPAVYHGKFGSGAFQIIYRHNRYSSWAYVMMLEWHALAALMLLASFAMGATMLLYVAAAMWAATLYVAARSAASAASQLPPRSPWWSRPLIFVLHLAQPVVRSWERYATRLRRRRILAMRRGDDPAPGAILPQVKRISFPNTFDVYWTSNDGRGREHLLPALADVARQSRLSGDFQAEWCAFDAELHLDLFHKVEIRTATEELGGPNRFTRVRCTLRPTRFAGVLTILIILLLAGTALSHRPYVHLIPIAMSLVLLSVQALSLYLCTRTAGSLVARAGLAASLTPVTNLNPRPNATRAGACDIPPLDSDEEEIEVATV